MIPKIEHWHSGMILTALEEIKVIGSKKMPQITLRPSRGDPLYCNDHATISA